MAFEQYFLMDEAAVKDYIRKKTNIFSHDDLSVTEIGDGNLNYVFHITDGEQSVIVKHSGHIARISDEFKLSTDRTVREGAVLSIHGGFVPDLVPEIYLVDDVMKCVVMEDLSDYKILRHGLLDGHIYPYFGKHIGRYLAETLIRTSDFILPAKEKKELQKALINPELCEISEDLVYTEPFYNPLNRNEVSDALLPFVEQMLYKDDGIKRAVAAAKLKFLNKAECLIHGDLHSGSIFVNDNETKVIDPEFGFFGPAGYDLGNVLAHLFFAYAYAETKGRTEQQDWIFATVQEVLSEFKSRAHHLLLTETCDIALNQPATIASYIQEIERDAYVVMGLELIRRIVGLAKVADITEMDEAVRLQKEIQLIKFAKFLIQNPESVTIYPSLFSLYFDCQEKVA